MRLYEVSLTGSSPLLLHNDDIEWADRMDAWRANKDNKKHSKAGDDRTPAFRWIGNLYRDDKQVIMPTENIMAALLEGGAMVPVPGGKNGKTFKSQSQSGIMPQEIGWPITINGKNVPLAPIDKLLNEPKFDAHQDAVQDMGFTLYLKRARIGSSKHVRVRPRFDTWTAAGTLAVADDQITDEVLSDILEMAGKYKGVGDWRPSAPKKPGVYGRFEATVARIN